MTYTAHIQQREPKVWASREAKGLCVRTTGRWQQPTHWLGKIVEWLEEPFGTIAILATCGYMLTPMIDALREAGIPFYNPWRTKQREWNPLSSPPKGVGIIQRLRDFLRPVTRLWTWGELATWIHFVRSDGILVHGAKAIIARNAEKTTICTIEELQELFFHEALDALLHGGIQWLTNHILQSESKSFAYPFAILRRYGMEGLHDTPRVIVGTIHSMKGGEADRVVLFTELSRSQYIAQCEGGQAADDIWRMGYVGVTRAREALYVVRGR